MNKRVQLISPGGQPLFKHCRAINPGTTMNRVRSAYQKHMDRVTLRVAIVTLDFAKAKRRVASFAPRRVST